MRRYLPAVCLFIGGLAAWELVVKIVDIQGFLLPKPSAILAVYWEEQAVVWRAGRVTLIEAGGGFGGGTVMGMLVGFGAALFSPLRQGVMPFAVAVSSSPIIALAPIFNAWFGSTNPVSKMAVGAVMVFFSVLINMVRGVTSFDSAW